MTDITLRDEIATAVPGLYSNRGELNLGTRNRLLIAEAILAVPRIAVALRQAAAIEATVEAPGSPDAPAWYGSSSAHGWFCGWDAGYLAAISGLRAVGADPPPLMTGVFPSTAGTGTVPLDGTRDATPLTGDCEVDCQQQCAYPGQFSECEMDTPEVTP